MRDVREDVKACFGCDSFHLLVDRPTYERLLDSPTETARERAASETVFRNRGYVLLAFRGAPAEAPVGPDDAGNQDGLKQQGHPNELRACRRDAGLQ